MMWSRGDLHECPLALYSHHADDDCVAYATDHGDHDYDPHALRDTLRTALAAAGFIDPDDGTVPMFPHGVGGYTVWVPAWRLVDTIIANLPRNPN